ncbi:MAG: ATP-binding cassette domain-containing protein [Gammaproteobacteria bacterium]|nr:ATP-binding cassette domain-containing protein [Gammaproteobacteria bacterium]
MSKIDSTMSDILQVIGFGAAFGDRIILSDVNLTVPERGVMTLLGPSGTGKSTLLRSLVGLNDANPSFRTWGEVYFQGESLDGLNRPALVSQSAKLMMSSVFENVVHNLPERNNLDQLQQKDLARRLLEDAGIGHLIERFDDSVMSLSLAEQRHLAIVRMSASGTRLLCLDEPTTGINDQEANSLLDYINKEAERRAILIVLHNLKQAKRLKGHIALLAGGQIQEVQSTESFIESPKSVPARQWVKLGSCNVPSPDASPEDLADDVPPPPPLPAAAKKVVSSSFGPRGFLWLKRGVLAGTPLPGVFHDIDYDLMALQKVGITVLLSLTTRSLDEETLNKYGIRSIWEPVTDMGAPSLEQAISICEQIEIAIKQDEVVAAHCRAGLGRTGTILAAYLIWEGVSAIDALDTVRGVEPRWVQSEEQVMFLEAFENEVVKKFSKRSVYEVVKASKNDRASYV